MNDGVAASPNSLRSIPLPDNDILQLIVPVQWKHEIKQAGEGLPPTIEITPESDEDFVILVTPLWNAGHEKEFNSPDRIRALMEEEGQKHLASSAESSLSLFRIKGERAVGFFYTLTDKAAKTGKYKYLTRVGIGVDGLLISATILTNVKDSQTTRDALSMLVSARQTTQE